MRRLAEDFYVTDAPTSITADKQTDRLRLEWPDGRRDAIPFWDLRCACPCAVCVSELTGERLLDPAKIDSLVHPTEFELAGNYAVKVRWSDGHHTGLFTWSHLRALGEQTS